MVTCRFGRMGRLRGAALCCAMALCAALLPEARAQDDQFVRADQPDPPFPQVFGWIEKVMIVPGRRWKVEAKLDTGADTSSLDARNIRRVRVGDKAYVRFSVFDPLTGESVSLRRPYVRSVRIRRHDGQHQRFQSQVALDPVHSIACRAVGEFQFFRCLIQGCLGQVHDRDSCIPASNQVGRQCRRSAPSVQYMVTLF